jgi:chondroitin 4-sulfotransferase 11
MRNENSLAPLKRWVPMAVRYRLMELRGRSLYSGYADAHRCIFIHIPKTGGTSIARALFNTGSRHVPCVEYEKANRRKFRRYFKFAFVRNPWDRLLSAYHFLKRGGLSSDDRAWAENNLAASHSFEQFVHEWVNEININSWVHFRPQVSFITDASGRMAMDYVGRIEHIDADFELICQRIGVSVLLPRLNKVEKEHYAAAYSMEMIEIVRKAYERDIEWLNYSFTSC